MQVIGKYCEYFDVDEDYFPCIDDSAIRNGAKWESTYPHETFIQLLEATEKMLAGSTRKSLWIHGSYGTGKSQCAYALKRILEVPEDELKAYWDEYSPLKNYTALFNKLIGHKKRGIISAWRYASGSMATIQQFFLAVQESISEALDAHGSGSKAHNTLRASVLSWLEDETHARFLDDLLRKPEWTSLFSQSCADDVINALKNNRDVTGLMENIFTLAAKEGITALNLTADSLRDWIVDVIRENGVKIVLIWDEFSDFFKLHRNSLSDFQKIVSICEQAPFYFIIVTHHTEYGLPGDDAWKYVQQRFSKSVIEMPDNIAFKLTRHAFSIKKDKASEWREMLDDLVAETHDSSHAVAEAVNISELDTIHAMLPIHPMAALALKNIAVAFGSNQRSMFDFIKTQPGSEDDMKAFQHFIRTTGPGDDKPLLTADMLWDFFYAGGREYLSHDVRMILDVFGETMSKFPGLDDSEQAVLKAILILQALTQRTGRTMTLLFPTDRTIKYVFEGGNRAAYNRCTAIAQSFVSKGILIQQLDGNREYSAAVLAGKGEEIALKKQEVLKNLTSAKIVSECGSQLITALNPGPALRLRYEILPAVSANFKAVADDIRRKELPAWKFRAVFAVAKDDDEAQALRKHIREIAGDEMFRDVVIIDVSSSPLGAENFGKYADSLAMSLYYAGSNGTQAKQAAERAEAVLTKDWAGRISSGEFTVYSAKSPGGERVQGSRNLNSHLEAVVLSRFRHVQDFARGVTQSQLDAKQLRNSAYLGLSGGKVSGIMSGADKGVLGRFWDNEGWLDDPSLAGEPVVITAKSLHALIEAEFEASGNIPVSEIWGHLSGKFGYSVCNLSAFIAGFILRKYSAGEYRSLDGNNHSETMSAERLADILANWMARKTEAFIVKRTNEEQAFYRGTAEAWGIPLEELSSESAEMAADMIHRKARELGFPLWSLKYEATPDVWQIIAEYAEIQRADKTMDYFTEIGRAFMVTPSLVQELRLTLTHEACRRGMMKFLAGFEGGILPELAEAAGAGMDALLSDISRLFSTEYSDMWNEATGHDQIRKLITEYDFVKATDDALGAGAGTKNEALRAWRECADMSGCSCEDAAKRFPELKEFLGVLQKIAARSDIQPQVMRSFTETVKANIQEVRAFTEGGMRLFAEVYSSGLEGLSDEDCRKVRETIRGLFTMPSVQAAIAVKQSAATLRKNRMRARAVSVWSECAEGTRSPREWSKKFRLPVLLCFTDPAEYSVAENVFGLLNAGSMSEEESASVMSFLETLKSEGFFERIRDEDFRDRVFSGRILGGKYSMLAGNAGDVKDALMKSGIEPYSWYHNPGVDAVLKELAGEIYSPDDVDTRIAGMSDTELRRMLRKFAADDMELGMKILAWE